MIGTIILKAVKNGQKASTTRNIYGIYDMAGGAWEYMANSIEEGDGDTQKNQLTELNKYIPNFATIYKGKKDDGKITDSKGNEVDDRLGRLANYKENKEVYGDAIWETSSANQKGTEDDKAKKIVDSENEKYIYDNAWNGDYSSFYRRMYPFFRRGGYFNSSNYVGVFSFSNAYGGTDSSSGFRVVAL